MKNKLLIFATLVVLLLSGCSNSSAKQHGSGISVEMSDSLNIKHMTIIKYVGGIEAERSNVINADSSSFKKGDVTWFDIPLSSTNSTVEIAISYSENADGTNSKTTPKLDISSANKWVNVKFSDNYELQLIELD